MANACAETQSTGYCTGSVVFEVVKGMDVLRILKGPIWAVDALMGQKSFKKNPIIGSRWLNERGFYLKRVAWAERMAALRRRQMAHYLTDEDRAFFHRNGYLVKENFLPSDVLKQVQDEIATREFAASEMRQGKTVTRFIGLPPSVLKDLPGLQQVVHDPFLQKAMRYVASYNADPILFLHAVLWDLDKTQKDPQTDFHIDTFHATSKCWLFLKDVEAEDGPFHYVPGSHRYTPERREWEFDQSLDAVHHSDGMHAAGSFRASEKTIRKLGYGEPVSFAVPANTLVIADTHGFHRRGIATRPGVRLGLFGDLRRSPYFPWSGLDARSLPGIKGRQSEIYTAYLNFRSKLTGKSSHHQEVGHVKIDAPPVL
ncbi:Ectoine hydroxylase-related dioxygenase, phytanoyl-CoA dioxygenase (PhyH) family [Pseudovibrio denitrificans]|uniref:Ectoine hydroxylase-related dioxygenase, phytanoyl-CoA dioxygenase (PhyH) family n=1 Tax=Pseudovibrio denitrificans TaxID=258256 RepID=A0A1I7BSD2_9HYPH|nr:phytanoyl-CoA dioxygenase family protein [Pseudovibrio denitrificans]SFT90088.1 Ectoine hydroxylase-related dioxygenase, phytanoyl-CoA dioxygenase (PhyH) family [Pseudovibrio denitrificans]